MGERGFTLVEVLAAIAILLVGTLGVVALADGASDSTSRTRANEAANGLARDMLESVQGISYETLTGDAIGTTLRARDGMADARGDLAGWQVVRRGVTYTVTTTLCVLDDPKDGMGAHDSTYCSDVGAAGTADVNPNDYKRVSITLEWNRGHGDERLTQSTLITNNDRGPAVVSLDTSPAGNAPVTSGNTVRFDATTSSRPDRFEWYLDGAYQGDLSSGVGGSGTSYSFTWQLGGACSSNAVIDGTYVVSGQAFNASQSSPGPRALTVSLNRCAPYPVTAVQGGRNRWGVEIAWADNKEDDVVGYRVARGINGAAPTLLTSGPCGGLIKETSCIEPDPQSNRTLTYTVRAVDRAPGGALRDGAASAAVSVATNNRAPTAPTLYSAGTTATLAWGRSTDPDSGDVVDFYRIYRDGQALADRYDVIDTDSSPILWTDDDSGGVPHTYYVVAVDNRLAESAFSNGITR
jgi:prepilin-type N-terminal cleavage/methylation domain-containing protein